MSNSQRLRDTLDQLHAQLADADALDEEVRSRLRAAVDEIRERLEAEGGEPHSLAERLTELRQDFEESHPNLAAAVGRVVDALTSLGI